MGKLAKAKAKEKARGGEDTRAVAPGLGKIAKVRAKVKSYIQVWDEKQAKFVLLVNVSEKMSKEHKSVVDEIWNTIQETEFTKEQVIDLRDSLLAAGGTLEGSDADEGAQHWFPGDDEGV